MATASPTWFTSPRARAYWVRGWVRSGCGISRGSGSARRPGRSSQVYTPTRPVDVERAAGVDAGDAGVGVGAAHEGRGQGVVTGVVQEPARAPDQALVLPALDPLAEPLGGHGPSPASSAARRTERTMLT